MKYRTEIDGLRAIAVIPVILFHAGFALFSGGYVGVDIFFVISGYLITNIIYTELCEKRFSILNFYERRARRILPALFFIVLACVPFAYLWMLPVELKDFFQSIFSISLFISNLLFWKETGYFGAATELKPLIHTWSLAIEEQYYVFFPVLLVILYKIRTSKSFMLAIVSGLVFVSLIASALYTAKDPNSAFYLLPFRFWELGIGSILAFLPPKLNKFEERIDSGLSVLGLVMIFCAVFLFDKMTPFPSYTALLPCVGTALVIRYASTQNLIGKFLSIKAFVKIGLLSYSLYLIHQPVFAFARIRSFEGLTQTHYIVLILLSSILAYISWKYVEAPFRNKRVFDAKKIFALSAIGLVGLLVLGGGGTYKNGFPDRLTKQGALFLEASADLNPTNIRCMATPAKPRTPEEACVLGQSDNVKIALWGDSHAMAISTELGNELGRQNVGMLDLSHVSCPPSQNLTTQMFLATCLPHNRQVFDFLVNDEEIETVVLFARWSLYFSGKRFDNGEGAHESGPPSPAIDARNELKFQSEDQRKSEVEFDILATVNALLEANKRVVIVLSVPEPAWHVPNRLARATLVNTSASDKVTTLKLRHIERDKDIRNLVAKLAPLDNVSIIDPVDIFCGTNRCFHTANQNSIYADDDHLNSKGSAMLSKALMKQIMKK